MDENDLMDVEAFCLKQGCPLMHIVKKGDVCSAGADCPQSAEHLERTQMAFAKSMPLTYAEDWSALKNAARELRHVRFVPGETADSLTDLLGEVEAEIRAAEAKWPPMHSAHEAYAVLLEKVDELWDHVKVNQKRRDLVEMRKEAVQVAAMALRFVRDICDAGRGRA